MKFLAVLLIAFGLYLSLPHLQKLLLGGLVNQKVEQLKDDMMESLPLGSQELPLAEIKPLEADKKVGPAAPLPLPIQ